MKIDTEPAVDTSGRPGLIPGTGSIEAGLMLGSPADEDRIRDLVDPDIVGDLGEEKRPISAHPA